MTTISLTDPTVTIAGIKQFGLAPDGSDLRDLTAAIERIRAENELLRAIQSAAKTVLETFERDEAQGYRSRDRQFAIEVLRPAFEQKADKP